MDIRLGTGRPRLVIIYDQEFNQTELGNILIIKEKRIRILPRLTKTWQCVLINLRFVYSGSYEGPASRGGGA